MSSRRSSPAFTAHPLPAMYARQHTSKQVECHTRRQKETPLTDTKRCLTRHSKVLNLFKRIADHFCVYVRLNISVHADKPDVRRYALPAALPVADTKGQIYPARDG